MITNKLGFRSALVSFSLVLFGAIGFIACAAPVIPEEEAVVADEEQVGVTQDAIVRDCCYGYLTCPTTGKTWDYFLGPASCGEVPYSQASIACNNACAAACPATSTGCIPN